MCWVSGPWGHQYLPPLYYIPDLEILEDPLNNRFNLHWCSAHFSPAQFRAPRIEPDLTLTLWPIILFSRNQPLYFMTNITTYVILDCRKSNINSVNFVNFLDRHYVCLSHDPTLGIWSTFVKNWFSSFFSFLCLFTKQDFYVFVSLRQLTSAHFWILCFSF